MDLQHTLISKSAPVITPPSLAHSSSRFTLSVFNRSYGDFSNFTAEQENESHMSHSSPYAQSGKLAFGIGNAASRRELLLLAQNMMAGVVLANCVPSIAIGAEEKRKIFTNLEDARQAGEKLRDEKEIAEGPVITLPSGVKYRELERGTGKTIIHGDLVSVYYTISRLNGYYVDSTGYGKEGKNDVGETFTFQYGQGLVPVAVEAGMVGMQVGGRRRILVTPDRGWVEPDLLPAPTTGAAQRRLTRAVQPFLFEVEVVRAKSPSQ